MAADKGLPQSNGNKAEWLIKRALAGNACVEPGNGTIDLKVNGVWLEVKSCQEYIAANCNAGYRRGCFILHEAQHKFLLNNDGYYAFIVTSEDGTAKMKIMPAEMVGFERQKVWTKVVD